jgi:hypothetical protein
MLFIDLFMRTSSVRSHGHHDEARMSEFAGVQFQIYLFMRTSSVQSHGHDDEARTAEFAGVQFQPCPEQ